MVFSIDHIVIAVADLDAAMRDYEALGFTMVPGGEHPRGSRNALVCFDDGCYLEIIAFSRPLSDFRWWQVLSEAGCGLVDYALLPDDFDAALAGARTRGLDLPGPIDGARLRPDGVHLAWVSARPVVPDIPFLCGDVTPRDLRVPTGGARKHRNGVTGVAGVTTLVWDLDASVARHRALLGDAASVEHSAPGDWAGLAQIKLGPQTLSVAAPQAGAMADLLSVRGQGPCAISLYGPEPQGIDPTLTHGVPLEILRRP